MVRGHVWFGLGLVAVMGCSGEAASRTDAGTSPGLDAGLTQETCNGQDDDGDSLVDEGMVTLRFTEAQSTHYLGDGLEAVSGFDLVVQPGVATVRIGDGAGAEFQIEFDPQGRLTKRSFLFEGQLRTTRMFVHGPDGLAQETNGAVVRTLAYQGGVLERVTLLDGADLLAVSEVTLNGARIAQEDVDFFDALGSSGVDGVVDDRRTFTYAGEQLTRIAVDITNAQGERGPDGTPESVSTLTWSDGPGPDLVEVDELNGAVPGTDGEVDVRSRYTYADGRLVKVEIDTRPDPQTPLDGRPDSTIEVTWTPAGNLASIPVGAPLPVSFTCSP